MSRIKNSSKQTDIPPLVYTTEEELAARVRTSLKNLRINRNMTLTEVERQTGIPSEHVSQIEKGTRKIPRTATLQKLVRTYGVTLNRMVVTDNQRSHMHADLSEPPKDDQPNWPKDERSIFLGYQELWEKYKVFAREFLRFLEPKANPVTYYRACAGTKNEVPGTKPRPLNFAKYIKELRNRRGLSLQQAAIKAKISDGYLSQIEEDKRGIPSIFILLRLAKAYHGSLSPILQVADSHWKPVDIQPSLKEEYFVLGTYKQLSETKKYVFTEFMQFLVDKTKYEKSKLVESS